MDTVYETKKKLLRLIIRKKRYMCKVGGNKAIYKFQYGVHDVYDIQVHGKKIDIYGLRKYKGNDVKNLYKEIKDWPMPLRDPFFMLFNGDSYKHHQFREIK